MFASSLRQLLLAFAYFSTSATGNPAKDCVTYDAGNEQPEINQQNETIPRTGIQNCGGIKLSLNAKIDRQSDKHANQRRGMDHPPSSGQAQGKCPRGYSYQHRRERHKDEKRIVGFHPGHRTVSIQASAMILNE
ncbi:hypothetical protein BST67_17970 [Bradyrhizobium canariense]|nr:hypothetical protein BST66_10850 [Bradyrhizobium canariense]OSI48560.1 hypothetical protein BST67_17970 [Bradyrhizobium canariense]OSI53606.1 hypothetical protein BSZ15_25055 [Bradyrhizobium canariense]